MFNQIKYQNEYNRKNLDRITVTVKKGEKEKIRKRAEEKGFSLNAYIKSLIDKDLTGGGGRTMICSFEYYVQSPLPQNLHA